MREYKKIYLLIIVFLMTMISCNSKSLNETDYLIYKATDEKAVLILFPCFPCDKINTKNEATFLKNIEDFGITTILLDYNQKLFLNEFEKEILAKKLNSILIENKIFTKKIFIGGFSSGGNITVLISNYLIKTKNELQPSGIFVVDSPLDLEELYKNAQSDINSNENIIAVEEAVFLIDFLENTLGKPETNIENYKINSPYLISQNTSNNIDELKEIKTRFYTEPDLEWQKINRNRKFQDLNAYKIEQTYEALKKLGSKKTEIIKTENQGFRSNGEKNPHSWSIVEKENLINWILE